MVTAKTDDLTRLVQGDRVHRSVYTDPAIFDEEMSRIFGRAWVFVGHDSQVPDPGDFITTAIGRMPVIMARHTDGSINVIYNSCGHRGAIVCNQDSGNAELFRCCYHGWTFKTNGDLDAVSMPRGYGDQFDLTDPSLGMGRLPRVGIYRGFIFASLAADGPSLDDHLGAAKDSIDEVCDRAPDGEIELTGGVHRYMFAGNWKLQLENVVDMYHVPFSHESTLERGGRQFSRREGDTGGSAIGESGAAAARWEQRPSWGSPARGHSFVGNQPIAEERPDTPVFRAYLAALEGRHGKQRTQEILTPKRHNTAFYPNMALQALNQHVRVIRPVSVDRTEVRVYPIKFKGAPAEMNRAFVRHINLTHSAASFIQTDDLECFRRCQEGVEGANSEWVYFARGVESDKPDNRGDLVNAGTVELPQRSQYAAWARYMAGEPA